MSAKQCHARTKRVGAWHAVPRRIERSSQWLPKTVLNDIGYLQGQWARQCHARTQILV